MPETLEGILVGVGALIAFGLVVRLISRSERAGRVFDGASDAAHGFLVFAISATLLVALIIGVGYLLGVGAGL